MESCDIILLAYEIRFYSHSHLKYKACDQVEQCVRKHQYRNKKALSLVELEHIIR